MDARADIDKLFEKFAEKYVLENKGKFTAEEWEDKIPELYEKFGKTAFDELGGKTPETYFSALNGEELVALLSESAEQGSVSDYLCEAIVAAEDSEKPLIALLGDLSEEKVMYALNLLGDKDSASAVPAYLELVTDGSQGEHVRELAAELLCRTPELCKERLLRLYGDADDGEKLLFCDILSRCRPDERVYAVLESAFLEHPAAPALYSSFLARYGDERALPALYEAIENKSLDYAEFRELRFAIETLGGEYDKPRDFSSDKIYKKLSAENRKKRK